MSPLLSSPCPEGSRHLAALPAPSGVLVLAQTRNVLSCALERQLKQWLALIVAPLNLKFDHEIDLSEGERAINLLLQEDQCQHVRQSSICEIRVSQRTGRFDIHSHNSHKSTVQKCNVSYSFSLGFLNPASRILKLLL